MNDEATHVSTLVMMKKDILMSVILTIVTCGIYGFFWQAHQISTVNMLLKQEKYSFWRWLIFSLLTCGLYHIYYEYVMGQDIFEIQVKLGFPAPNNNLSIMSLVLSLVGLAIIVDAIQQNELNKTLDNA